MLLVMWAVALAALVVSSVQLFGYRQSMLGRDALHRVQARWAARGGIEYTIAILADHTEFPVFDDAFAMVREMDQYAQGEFEIAGRIVAGYDIRHYADGQTWWGPMDEHSKININLASENPSLLINLPDMTLDVVDAILDWMDGDDDVRPLGAEREYYLNVSVPYEPRNGPLQNIAELELVAGIWPEHLRGEDWNFNNRIDANEDDGDRTWPMDEPDQRLDARWSALFTTESVQGRQGGLGLPLIQLGTADPELLMERLGVDEQLAGSLISFGQNRNNRLEQLLTRFATLQAAGGELPGTVQQQTTNQPLLSEDQLRAVLAETTMEDPRVGRPGTLNINTASELVLQQLLIGKEYLADEIVYLRNSRPEGITSLVDLLQVPAFREDTATLEYLAGLMDTRSWVYSIASRGRSWAGGMEVEIIAVVDRSTLPVRILEYREQ